MFGAKITFFTNITKKVQKYLVLFYGLPIFVIQTSKTIRMIRLTSNVRRDAYTNYIQENFDLTVEDVCTTEINAWLKLDNLTDWNILLVLGGSGSGKTTALKQLGEISTAHFKGDRCLISEFDNMSPKDASELLIAMGLASVPSWLHPYDVLSNGERYRADLAKILSEAKDGDVIIVDEYTSVVDRTVARAMSSSLGRYVRKHNIKIVLASCHYDIVEWLGPDYIFDLNKGGALERCDCLRRPSISLQVYRTTSDTWDIFKKHHYLTADMNMGAYCFCFTWEDKLVGFVSALANPMKGVTNAWRLSRTVVLPDFQGMGLGSRISEFVAGIFKAKGMKVYTKTVNPRLGEYREHSPNWRATSYNGKSRSVGGEGYKYTNRLTRASYNHEYVGEPIYGYEDLLLPTEKMRYNKSMEGQLSLF